MASAPLIFPSLSRQPSMDSSKQSEDDTIRDQAESGYVSTRPRFTRARDTWKINVRNLTAEDKRALDTFERSPTMAARGGNSFLYPNFLPNWSFEFPAVDEGDLVYGWSIGAATPALAVGTTGAAWDGSTAVLFSTVAGQHLAAAATAAAALTADPPIACVPGDAWVAEAMVNAVQGALGAGMLQAYLSATFYDGNGAKLSQANSGYAAMGVGWQALSFSFTIPANAVTFAVALNVAVDNTGGTTLTLDGSASVAFDAAGCALQTPVQIYGRMAGSDALPRPVRFTKLPEYSDIGYGAGVKRYGVNFELTEV